MAGVKFKPLWFTQLLRVESISPVVIMPAGCANIIVKYHYSCFILTPIEIDFQAKVFEGVYCPHPLGLLNLVRLTALTVFCILRTRTGGYVRRQLTLERNELNRSYR